MRSRILRPWLVGQFLLVACAKPPDISDDIQTYAELVGDANSLTCECPQTAGYQSYTDCGDALGPVASGERQCMAQVLEGHEDAAVDYLACASAAYDAYVDCLGMNPGCEQDVFDDCVADHETSLSVCPLLPVDVQSAFDACAM